MFWVTTPRVKRSFRPLPDLTARVLTIAGGTLKGASCWPAILRPLFSRCSSIMGSVVACMPQKSERKDHSNKNKRYFYFYSCPGSFWAGKSRCILGPCGVKKTIYINSSLFYIYLFNRCQLTLNYYNPPTRSLVILSGIASGTKKGSWRNIAETPLFSVWALLDSNQWPSACKADALNQLS